MNLIARKRDGQALAAVPLRMSRLFDNLFDTSLFGTQGLRDETWFPPMDVLETTESIEVLVDLPGIDPDDVEVSIQDDRLEISGSRATPTTPEDARWYRFERHTGEFRRTLVLPLPVDGEKAQARSEHGQLRIVLPKVAAVLPKRIAIQSA